MAVNKAELLSINKSTAAVCFKKDADIDLTAIRIGKQRVASKKNNNVSKLKQAILLAREAAPQLSEVSSETPAHVHMGQVVDHAPTTILPSPTDLLVEEILKELCRLQARGKEQPLEKRYKYKKYVVGLREVQRSILRSEVLAVIIATNLEEGVAELDDSLKKMEQDCAERGIPVVHSLTRRRLGKVLNKSMKQSLVGIVSLEGVHPQWKKLTKLMTDTGNVSID